MSHLSGNPNLPGAMAFLALRSKKTKQAVMNKLMAAPTKRGNKSSPRVTRNPFSRSTSIAVM
jgi:hypothetical protein